jgi:hypothetical protein
MAVAERDCNAIEISWEEVGALARHAVEAVAPTARTRRRGMSQDEVDRKPHEPAEELGRKPHDPADVEAHMRVREPAEDEAARKPHEPADVEAHIRAHGPPLIEDEK